MRELPDGPLTLLLTDALDPQALAVALQAGRSLLLGDAAALALQPGQSAAV